MPKSETTVMLSTVAVTLFTHNLAIGVGVGVLVACVLFAQRIAHLVNVDRVVGPDGTARYAVDGALFFASSNDLYTQFEYADDPEQVVIDLSNAQVWDASTVAALDAITHKYATRGKTATIVGLDEHSFDRFERHTGQLNGAH
jgi:SulP family sulfate permease